MWCDLQRAEESLDCFLDLCYAEAPAADSILSNAAEISLLDNTSCNCLKSLALLNDASVRFGRPIVLVPTFRTTVLLSYHRNTLDTSRPISLSAQTVDFHHRGWV
jgi:hypothetical protein